MAILSLIDPIIARLIRCEEERQCATLSLIASENYVSKAIREATASVLTNKYAEGYPGKRYYAGCAVVDQVEQLAIDRCKQLFGVVAANVQPHAGCPANFAVYAALLNPGDTMLGMSLAHGGHLTHGHTANMSSVWYKSVSYGVNPETGLLDYDEVERLAHQHKPKLIIAGASAYSRIIDFEKFAQIAQHVGAYLLADIAHIAGLVAVGLHPSPASYADVITSTTHKTLRGPRGGIIMTASARVASNGQSVAEAIDRAIIPGTQGGPIMSTIAAKAVCFHEASLPDFVTYQQQIIRNAQRMVEVLQGQGYRIVSGGTDNHLFIIDLCGTKHTGLSAQKVLERVGITVSRSCIPNDPQPPWRTSGIRIGTPAATTRGMTEHEAETIAVLLHETLQAGEDIQALDRISAEVARIARQLPVP